MTLQGIVISIHAPRAGCDLHGGTRPLAGEDFNPRTPCGVRLCSCRCSFLRLHFNPRTPCGVRRLCDVFSLPQSVISIHAPRAGCDSGGSGVPLLPIISIHAPRAGCDRDIQRSAVPHAHFNPRTPCGVRRSRRRNVYGHLISIHAPRAGCDNHAKQDHGSTLISIHAPRAGCDLLYLDGLDHFVKISIHAPRAGCDSARPQHNDIQGVISIHAPRAGCDRDSRTRSTRCSISIHAPRAGCDLPIHL